VTGPDPSHESPLADAPLEGGRLIENVMYFARTLRAAGLPVGPGKVLAAIQAVEAVGVARRDESCSTRRSTSSGATRGSWSA
jgi:uncharacterized protein with von Willebrand factor type A (vWA) domain